MAQMLDNPMMQQMMDNMMSNPEMMEMVMNMNPQLRQMMMRNVDRAMSNLETVPGGMDALRRLHNDIQDPLWDAMQGQDQQSGSAPQTYTAQDTSQAPSAAPMSNPWGGGGGAPAAPP